MFKNRIQKQEKKELVNPMLFMTERMTSDGQKFELNPVYLLTDNIMNNALQSDEIYNKRGIIAYNVQNDIYEALYNRISFLIKNEFFKIVDEVRVNLIDKNIFGKEFEQDMNEVCDAGIRLLTGNFTTDYNALESKVINAVRPLLDRYNTSSVYSMDLIINRIVETIYNAYMIKIEEILMYYKSSRHEKLNADQLGILYDVPTVVTVKLGLVLGTLLEQFVEYKTEKMKLINPKAIKLTYNNYNVDEEEDY